MFLQRLIIVLLLVTVASFITGKFFDYRYRNRWNTFFFSKPDEAINGKTNYDILFFGNSKTHSGLNPYYIDSVTKMSSYNLAIGSGDEQEIKLLGTIYLQHHTAPKFVIIGLDNAMMIKYNILKERFSYLFYLENDTVRSYMQKNGFPASLIRILPFMKYSFFDEYNRTSLFVGSDKASKFRHNNYKGFINIFPELNIPSTTEKEKSRFYEALPSNVRLNDTSAATFRQTVEMFHASGSRLIFLYPPVAKSRKPARSGPIDSFYASLAKKYRIPIIHADTNSLFTENYFVDEMHLNEPGSAILSLLVGDFIKELK